MNSLTPLGVSGLKCFFDSPDDDVFGLTPLGVSGLKWNRR